ncbi:EAL domain-containing protein, partial [Alistipes onderdonkii]|nr:EAL domain-containing protein [Alistipes onderdonkii]
MEKMHAQGVRFYLDDFGTGYSNLSTLLELPFDVVKLDKSILWSVTEDERLVEFFALLASGFGV